MLDAAGARLDRLLVGTVPNPSLQPCGDRLVADLDAASLDDVRGFFHTYYVPNNAILALVGDFDVEDAKALVADTFGRVPRAADVPRPHVDAVVPTRVRLDVTDRVAAPSVAIGFDGPPASSPENGALSLASDLLGNGAFGLLRNRLVSEKGLASSVSASWTPGLLGGRFEIDATPTACPSTCWRRNCAPPSTIPGRAHRPKTWRGQDGALLSGKLAVEPLSDRTAAVAYATDILNDPELALKDDRDRGGNGRKAATVKKVLDPKNASTLIVRPGPRGNYPAICGSSAPAPLGGGAPE